jgi:signal transduction histidine kinase
MATLILIVLVGMLATNQWSLIGVTAAMNAFALFILLFALHIPWVPLRDEAALFVPFVVLIQWAVAGILLAARGTYLQTIRELGDTRIAYQRARQLDQLKDQFITHINHELRTPVMALQGHVELVLLADESLSLEERTVYLERAKRAGDSLVTLVSNILDVRRLEQENASFTAEIVPLRAAVEEAASFIDPREAELGERDLRLHVPSELAAWGHPVWVRQILTNLLSNAIKYSAPGTPVEVTARFVPETPAAGGRRQRNGGLRRQLVEVAVRDHGLGIPPEQASLLFERFVRLPRDLASNVPGNGLGLHLCRTLTERMGGRIWAESSGVAGEGSTFHLQLPESQAAVLDDTRPA